jgi:hypothetical protein
MEQRIDETLWRKRIKHIGDLAAAFQVAELQSEYQLEKLLEALGVKSATKGVSGTKKGTAMKKGASKKGV